MGEVEAVNQWVIPNFSQNNHSFRDLRSSVFGNNGWRFELRFQPAWRDSPFQNVVSLITLSKPHEFEGCIYWSLSVRDENSAHKFLCVNQKQIIRKLAELTPDWTVFPPETVLQGEIITLYMGDMIFYCKVKVEPRSHDASRIHGHSPFRASVENPTISDRKLVFLSTGELSDFTIATASGREFRVHMVILATHSDYLQTLFSHKDTKEMREKRVVFTDISGPVMERILHWIYAHTTGEGFLDENDVTNELIETVNRLFIPSMKSFISSFLSTNLTVNNVTPRAALGWLHFKDTAYKTIVDYFIDNAAEIIKTPNYAMMRDEEPLLIIELHEEMVRRNEIRSREQEENGPFIPAPVLENNFFVPQDVPFYRPLHEVEGFDNEGYLEFEARPIPNVGLHVVNHAGPPVQHGVRHRFGNQPNQMDLPRVLPLAHLAQNQIPHVHGQNQQYPMYNNFPALHQNNVNVNANIVMNALPLDNAPQDIIFNGVIYRPEIHDVPLWRDDDNEALRQQLMNLPLN